MEEKTEEEVFGWKPKGAPTDTQWGGKEGTMVDKAALSSSEETELRLFWKKALYEKNKKPEDSVDKEDLLLAF